MGQGKDKNKRRRRTKTDAEKQETLRKKKPLFNAKAWGKAKGVLREILKGYYSDPPGVSMYNKKKQKDGSVKKNKYGMDMIECIRGTNRTEAYHKNLIITF